LLGESVGSWGKRDPGRQIISCKAAALGQEGSDIDTQARAAEANVPFRACKAQHNGGDSAILWRSLSA
jgi:hypothetical protein